MIFRQAQIDKYLKNPDEGIKCAVIYGSNEGLINEYMKSFILSIAPDLYNPFQVVYLNDVDEGILAGEYNAQSLMGGRRVVVIKDAPDGMAKYLKPMLEKSASNALIVVTSSAFSKNSSMVKLATERDDMALIACYEDREEDIYNSARAAFIENGFTIAGDALQLLCSRLSSDRKANLGEIDKLITYAGDRRNITAEDIRALITDSSSLDTDDVCYFTAGGQIDKAQKAFNKLVNEGEEMVSIIRAMTYHFLKLLNCAALIEDGERLDMAVKKMRIIFLREPSFKKQAGMWKRDKIFSVLELLYKCEKDCKTTNMPAKELVSYLILQISGAANKL